MRLVSISLAGLLLCVITAPVFAETGNANDNRECATCHVMWLADFQDKTVETLIPYDPQPTEKSGRGPDVASTDLMCFSCHDGYVLESRYRWREHRHNHPVGQKVSDKVKIPKKDGKDVFPLNLDNKIYCGTCHSAHGIDWAQNKSAIFMRAVNNSSNMCRACHEDHGTGPQHGNHPIMLDIKRLPEQLVEAGAKIGPNNNMICETCHRQHGAPGDKLLAIDNAETSELCLTCHKTRNSLRNSKHDMSVVAPEFRNSKNQSPQKNGLCSACHVSHGAKGPRLAAIPADKNADPLEANCTNCHSSTGVASKATTGVHSHPVNVDIRKLDIKVEETGWQSTSVLAPTQPLQALPLYDKNGQRSDKATQVACSTCHDPHVWAKTDNDKQPVTADVKGDSNTSFLRIPQGKQSNLCLNCHIKERAAEFSKHNAAVHDASIAEKMRTTKDKVAEGLCETCHKTHNGYGPMMWARNEGLGQAPIERLCNDCHNKEGVAKEKLTGTYSHPMQIEQKVAKAHDKLPMFDEQGKHNPAGMIDCGTCHNVHQWDPANAKNENGSKKDSEGDSLNSFLRIPVNAEAALCVTCHSEHQFVVGTDHDLNISAPTAENKLGKNVKQTGVCGQCHVAHKAKTKTNLWARNLAVDNESADFFCRSCHVKDGPAAKKEIPTDRLSHPKNVSVWSGAVRTRGEKKETDKFTVFNSMGNPSHAGEIACPSCHNPHMWNPREKQKGPGVNIEGDANNSFLKMTNSENFVCADCHGLDALFRYQYFHSPSSRVKHSLFN